MVAVSYDCARKELNEEGEEDAVDELVVVELPLSLLCPFFVVVGPIGTGFW